MVEFESTNFKKALFWSIFELRIRFLAFSAISMMFSTICPIISHRFDAVLTDKQIDLIIGTLTTENKTDNRSVISLQNTGMDITGR